MKVVFALVCGALSGALVLVLGLLLYRGYILYASGASLTAVPLPQMLLDVMALPHYAAIGAGVGAAVSALLRLWSPWTDRRRHLAAQRPPDTVDHGEAPGRHRRPPRRDAGRRGLYRLGGTAMRRIAFAGTEARRPHIVYPAAT